MNRRSRDSQSPGADLGGVLAREEFRHAVEDAVGASVGAHAQARWPRGKKRTRADGSDGGDRSGEAEGGQQWREGERGITAGPEERREAGEALVEDDERVGGRGSAAGVGRGGWGREEIGRGVGHRRERHDAVTGGAEE